MMTLGDEDGIDTAKRKQRQTVVVMCQIVKQHGFEGGEPDRSGRSDCEAAVAECCFYRDKWLVDAIKGATRPTLAG